MRLAIRLAAGIVFVVFGVGKFSRHQAEVDSFRTYGLPEPDAFVYAIGVLEIVGGLMLLLGLGTRIAAFLLACNMVVAIIVSGIALGEWVSLTFAPFQLVLCLIVLRVGPGRRALDPEPQPA